MPVMCIECNETDKAFRINNVVFSKRVLREFFPTWEPNSETFWRYLLMMPFFAETKDASEAPTKIGQYAIAKAKRIQQATKVVEHAITPFMTMAAEMGHIDENNIGQLSELCHDHVCSCGEKKSPRDFGDSNVVDLRPHMRNRDGKTVH